MESGSPLFKTLFLGKYQFYLELLIPFLILMLFSKRRKRYWLFLPLLVGAPIFLYWMPDLQTSFGYNFNYLFAAGILFLLSFLCYDESPITLFCGVTIAFGVQHIAWNSLALFYDLMPNNASSWPLVALVFSFIGVYFLAYFIFFALVFILKRPYRWQKKDALSLLFGTIIIAIAAVLSQYVSPWGIIPRIYTIILMLLGIALEFVVPIAHEAGAKAKELEDEKGTLLSLLELQAKQSALAGKEQEILNMKFHDMKHQIGLLRLMGDEKKEEAIKELEKAVDIYGDYAKTGNETLDVILTQKSLICTEEGISFTYIIDGGAFSFMSASDLSSLFGNLLDNAIEAASKEKGEYRLIKLSASVKGSFLSLVEENYASEKVRFSASGLPLSSKKNQIYHGYGSKSIKYIAQKYGGTFSFEQKGRKFQVSLLFPLGK